MVIDEHETFVLQEFELRQRLPFTERGTIVGQGSSGTVEQTVIAPRYLRRFKDFENRAVRGFRPFEVKGAR